MKLIQINPLLIFVAIVSYLIGGHVFDIEIVRVKAINRVRLNEHADKPHNELQRLTSPDRRVDAIPAEIVEDPSNPNSSNGYAIYLVPAREKLDLLSQYPDQKVFYAKWIDNLELDWKEPKFLEVKYSKGDIFEFQNNWTLEKEYFVEIRLIPQNASYSLSKWKSQ
ncbi:MAG TPA: hypothetical protein VF596_11790 [Pyrinomonadaceae bacterium]|jgi:hypothetical protein